MILIPILFYIVPKKMHSSSFFCIFSAERAIFFVSGGIPQKKRHCFLSNSVCYAHMIIYGSSHPLKPQT